MGFKLLLLIVDTLCAFSLYLPMPMENGGGMVANTMYMFLCTLLEKAPQLFIPPVENEVEDEDENENEGGGGEIREKKVEKKKTYTDT